LFGTDGVRGRANQAPITAAIASSIAMAAGTIGHQAGRRRLAVIGKDTRRSGYMLEAALTAGFTSVGMDVVLVGPVPTPAIALLVRSLRGDLGVMITASHNPYHDNGIKIFASDGHKISDDQEREIERLVAANQFLLAEDDHIGRAQRLDDVAGRYVEFVKSHFPADLTLDGIKIALDCANGAAYKIAPTVLRELGAEVVSIGCEPNGLNINQDVGATNPARLQQLVRAEKAAIGLALDGDGDRLVVVDEQGAVVDGDHLIGALALDLFQQNQLAHNAIATTIISNLGLEQWLTAQGIATHRTQVGDRQVMHRLQQQGLSFGGEKSGHLLFPQKSTAGDGLLAALQLLALLLRWQKPASALNQLFPLMPQQHANLPLHDRSQLQQPHIIDGIAAIEKDLGSAGRLLVRPSGTEPLVRLLVEGAEEAQVAATLNQLKELLAAG
jgi:phosphoglucosamine mutase